MSELQVTAISNEESNLQPGFFKRLWWIFTSPGRLAAALAEKPKVLICMIIGALAMDIKYLVRMPLYRDMLRQAALAQSQSGLYEAYGIEMTPEMIEATLPTSMISGLIGGPLAVLAGFLFAALIFFAILKLMGGQGKYKAYLSVVVHSNMINVLYTLLVIPISYITNSLHEAPALTSLATLLSTDQSGTLIYTILSSIDVLGIWYYAVLAIGFVAVSRLKKKHVYAVTAGVFLIGVIINVVSVSAAKAFMQ